MPPAKTVAAKKAAATKRTASQRAAGTAVADFDAEREKIIASRKTTNRFEWEAYGRKWVLKRPNAVLLADIEELESISSFITYLAAHVVEEERLDFWETIRSDEDLEIDILTAMVESMGKLVYSEIPTQRS
jgi:hypothetical protein